MAGSVSVRRLMMRRFLRLQRGMPGVELYQRDADAGDPGRVNGLRLAGCYLYELCRAVLQTQFGDLVMADYPPRWSLWWWLLSYRVACRDGC
jgi:hypothetical protein